jgi:threonine aldolase
MAARLRKGVAELPGVSFTQETSANGVFAILPDGVADKVREHVAFYDWDTATGEVRWLTSWDTTAADVDRFVGLVSRYARTA